MKYLIFIIVILFLSPNAFSNEKLDIHIKNISGDVEIIRDSNDDPLTAKNNMSLKLGDFLATGYKSGCTLIIDKTAEIIVDPLTNLIINECFLKNNISETSIKLRMGSMTSHVKPEKGLKAKFSIKTPTSTVGVRGTKNNVTENYGFGTKVLGFSGTTELKNKFGQKERIKRNDIAEVKQIDQSLTPKKKYLERNTKIIVADIGRTQEEINAVLDTPTKSLLLPIRELHQIIEIPHQKSNFELNWSIKNY